MPNMRACIKAIGHRRKLRKELPERFVAAAGEPLFLPDLVKPARVAAIALNEVAGPNSEPARDPNVDRVALGEHRAARSNG